MSGWDQIDRDHPIEKPVWLKEWEWFHLCDAVDSRFEDIPLKWKQFPDMVPIRGTAIRGLNEFDIEQAAQAWFYQKGVWVEPTYKDFPPDLC